MDDPLYAICPPFQEAPSGNPNLSEVGVLFWSGTRNGKSVPTVYSGNGTENCVPFPLYTVGTLLPFLVPGFGNN